MIRKKKPSKGKVVIDLTGPQGNAYYLMATARRLAATFGRDEDKILKEMSSGDYEHLIKVFDREFGKYVILER